MSPTSRVNRGYHLISISIDNGVQLLKARTHGAYSEKRHSHNNLMESPIPADMSFNGSESG